MQFRTRWLTALCAVAVVADAPSAAAQTEVRFSGFTNGCFGLGCIPTVGAAYQAGVSAGGGVLTYHNSTFDDWTVSGFLGLGGGPLGGAGNFNNLGAFALNLGLAGAATAFTGQSFGLAVTFTRPTPLNPTQPAPLFGSPPPVPINGNTISFTALLRGTVTASGNGGVNVNFANNAMNFFSVDTDTSPSDNDFIFSFQLADMNVNPDAQPASVTANIQALGGIFPQATVPEPSTYALMVTGLVGLAGAARLRRRA